MLKGIRRSRVTVAVVVCTFTAASLAAYQVFYAVCAQNAATEQALASHARFAAWTFAREASAELERAARRVLAPVSALASAAVATRAPVAETPSALIALGVREAQRCNCITIPDVRFTFRVELGAHHGHGDDCAVSIGAVAEEMPVPPGGDVERSIAAAVRRGAALGVALGDPVIARLPGSDGLAIAYVVIPGNGGLSPHAERRSVAYGYAFDPATAGRAIFPALVANRSLLPPSPMTAMPVDSALSLGVAGSDGQEIFRSTEARGVLPGVRVAMGGAFEGLVVRAAMQPAFVSRVAVGNWTWNRSQFALGLITLSAGLVVVSLLQLHRERQLARMKSEFVSSVSHELRTPLAQIRMFAEMLRLGWVRSDEERQRSVAIIDQEARRLTHLVENILQFSRAERQAPRVSVEPLELEPLVDEVVEGFAPLARTRGVTVRTVHEGGEAHSALADRDALRQVLLNLLDNAVKYGPTGQTVTVGTGAGSEGRARVWVDDQGPGIPARDKGRIWEAFRRLDRDVEAGITGNGIGLAVVRELVHAQGGVVAVEDAPGRGARFAIELREGGLGEAVASERPGEEMALGASAGAAQRGDARVPATR